jgi:hypothetical protein
MRSARISDLNRNQQLDIRLAPVVPPAGDRGSSTLLRQDPPRPLLPSRHRRRAPSGKARAVPAAAALASTRARRAWRGSSSLAAVRLGGSAAGDGKPRCSSGVLLLLACATAGCGHGGAGSQAQIWAHYRARFGPLAGGGGVVRWGSWFGGAACRRSVGGSPAAAELEGQVWVSGPDLDPTSHDLDACAVSFGAWVAWLCTLPTGGGAWMMGRQRSGAGRGEADAGHRLPAVA